MRCKRILLITLAMIAIIPISRIAHADIVNINARVSGYSYPTNHAPVIGQVINPVNPVKLTLDAGTYTVTNATGLPGANTDYTAWSYNSGHWVWNFVIADDATRQVVLYGEAGGIQSTKAGIANHPAVQNYLAGFVLYQPRTLDFMIRDYGLYDNSGGISLNVSAVPVPAAFWLFGSSLLGLAGIRRRNCK